MNSPETEPSDQLHRLNGMAASGMRAELKGWVLQRLAILKQVPAALGSPSPSPPPSPSP